MLTSPRLLSALTRVALVFMLLATTISAWAGWGPAAANLSFYKVPMVCKSAPAIGCGSRAKPVLTALEAQSAVVAGAWLNRPGTVLAVQWKPNTLPAQRETVARQVFAKSELTAEAVRGAEALTLAKSFGTGKSWCAASGVDQLSREEAVVVANRLVQRVQEQTPLTADQQRTLASQIKGAFSTGYTASASSLTGTSETDRGNQVNRQILLASAGSLSPAQQGTLKAALAKGYRPVAGDKDAPVDAPKSCCSRP